jgi:hypothetical protein
MSHMIRHTPARVVMAGRKSHRQWLGISLQPGQYASREPPRAKKGFELRASRAVRNRETA